jgi:ppGpp synthetase/RelA/SpoT-type nucleotidyltranferase
VNPPIPSIQLRADAFAAAAAASLRQRIRDAGLSDAHQECTVTWRIKSEESIRIKELWSTSRNEKPFVNDYIGIRVRISHVGHIPDALGEIRRWAGEFCLVEQEVEDKYQRTGVGGYRAVHVDYLPLDPNPWLLPKEASVEVQIASWLQSIHGALSHSLIYKAAEYPSADRILRLETISDRIFEVDRLIAALSTSEPIDR